MKLTRRMFSTPRRGVLETSLVVDGPLGALQFHYAFYPPSGKPFKDAIIMQEIKLFAMGLECHLLVDEPEASYGEPCHILGNGQFCKHDGSSLWAAEVGLPLLVEKGSDAVFELMENIYEERMNQMAEV